MASFYNSTPHTGPGRADNPNSNNAGFQHLHPGQQSQSQTQSQNQQHTNKQPNFSQWQQPKEQQQQQQQQQSVSQPFWTPNVQQAASQVAAGFVASAATGNLTSEKVLTHGIDQMQKAFGGGIPGMEYIMKLLRSYFAVDNRYVKSKILLLLFPFRNKQWRRHVSEQNSELLFDRGVHFGPAR